MHLFEVEYIAMAALKRSIHRYLLSMIGNVDGFQEVFRGFIQIVDLKKPTRKNW
jgi:hypothetical protein